MNEIYILVHEGLSRWINAPNNGGECCATWADTVDELNRLLNRIRRLEEAGNQLKDRYILENENWDLKTVNDWNAAKEDKP